ncbi:MAG: LytTR family DNA-binding domain-containing protein [Bacteroidales bacterium]|nr:LytTR family DNA-binding domain-containing protein [Bacteroidales bacterium]
MIKCLAIDDEPLALSQLENCIKKTDFLELTAACQSALEAREWLQREVVDVLFIDINMPDLNGLDFVRSLASPPMVVFTTAYSEYAIEGYKVSAVDYLLKPYGLDEFLRAAGRVKRQYELLHPAAAQQAATSSSSSQDGEVLFLKTEYKTVRIETAHIRYVESMSEYLRFHTDQFERPVTAQLSLKKLEAWLPADRFMRVHRSYIVNLKRISEFSRQRITMDNGTVIPVGDLYKDRFNSYLSDKYLNG